jgi:hypothetical protein
METHAPGATLFELSRRQVLRLLAAGAGVTLVRLPHTRAASTAATSSYGFLTSEELAILDAATAVIIPTAPISPESLPVGARECGVVNYIQNMLSFMPGSDVNCDRTVGAADLTAAVMGLSGPPHACSGGDIDGNGAVDATDVIAAQSAAYGARPVHAGGPFSGRHPQPHFPTGSTPCYVCHVAPIQHAAAPAIAGGAASSVDNYPPDYFTQFLPLPRLRLLSWKIRILGADRVPEVATINNPLMRESPEVDLRNKYRAGLASLEAISQQPPFSKPFVQLTPQDQSKVLDKVDPPEFKTLLIYHTFEGMLCAPEYGGNRNMLGWQLIDFDGDSQPLGYEIYDETAPGNYRERDDKPNSRPNPDEDCSGFSNRVNGFLTLISSSDLTKPGGPFRDPVPYCFDWSPT